MLIKDRYVISTYDFGSDSNPYILQENFDIIAKGVH